MFVVPVTHFGGVMLYLGENDVLSTTRPSRVDDEPAAHPRYSARLMTLSDTLAVAIASNAS